MWGQVNPISRSGVAISIVELWTDGGDGDRVRTGVAESEHIINSLVNGWTDDWINTLINTWIIEKSITQGRLHQQNLIPYLVKSHLYLIVT